MSSTAVQPLESIAPINPAQQKALTDGERAARQLAFAPKLAVLNGAGMLLGAALSLVAALTDPRLLLWAAALAGCGFFELASGKRLRNFEPDAPARLAWNQLILLALVASYAGLQLAAALRGDFSLATELQKYPELAGMVDSIDDPQLGQAFDDVSAWFRTGLIVAYGGVLVASVLVQGGVALYYLSRRKHLRAFLATTPSWVIEWMRRRP